MVAAIRAPDYAGNRYVEGNLILWAAYQKLLQRFG